MRKKLSMFLVLLLLMSTPLQAFAQFGSNFLDMPADWSTEALEIAVDNGLLKGHDGKIRPYDSISRAEIATVINRAFGAHATASLDSFNDVERDNWYYSELAKAVAMGTLKGDGKTLRPDSPVTREEAFTILGRALSIIALDTDNSFMDMASISSWAREATLGLVNEGYVNGSEGYLNPKAQITRAEFAQLMHNIIKDYIKAPGVVEEVEEGNVMITMPDVTLKGVTITGDLIIGDGVGDGEVILEDVNVEGRLLVRGGGENSIVIKGNSDIGRITIVKNGNRIRVLNESGKTIQVLTVEGEADVILEGEFKEVTIKSPGITVNARNAVIELAIIKGERSEFIVDEDSKIEKIDIMAVNIVIEGDGDVEKVEVFAGGTGAKILTPNTEIDVNRGANNIIGTGEVEIEPNETYVNGSTPTKDAKPLENDSSGGSSGGGTTTPPAATYTINYSVVGSNGTLTATKTNGSSVESGTNISFTAIPDKGYRISTWLVNDTLTADNDTNELLLTVDENKYVEVVFEEIPVMTYPLNITVTPSDATITVTNSVDQVITGTFNGVQTSYDLPEGTYDIKVEKTGYYTRTITQNMIGPSSHIITLDEVLPGIVSIEEIPVWELGIGEILPAPPATVDVTLDTDVVETLDVVWDGMISQYDTSGNYIVYGDIQLVDGIENPLNLRVELKIDIYGPAEMEVFVTNTNVFRIEFDQSIIIDGTPLQDIPNAEWDTLSIMHTLLGKYEKFIDEYTLNPNNISIATTENSIEIEMLEDAILRDFFYEVDNDIFELEPVIVETGDGVVRIDTNIDTTYINTLFGFGISEESETKAGMFVLKVSVPFENGVPNYDAPIASVWQTAAQSNSETDPIRDSIAPELVTITSNVGEPYSEIWIEEDEIIEFNITASDENLYRMSFFPNGPEDNYWFYADETDVYNGSTVAGPEEIDIGVVVTYLDGTWTMNLGEILSADIPGMMLELEFEDYAGNKWSDVETNELNRQFLFEFNRIDRSGLKAIKADIDLLNPLDYSTETWADVDTAMAMPETTQVEIDAKYNTLMIAQDNLYELLVTATDNYTISSNTLNNELYVLDNDKGTLIEVANVTPAMFGATQAYKYHIEYTPNPGFVGLDVFEYEISDGNGGVSSAIVSITVNIDGTLVGTGEYGTDEIGIYQTPNGLTAVLENQISTTGLVIENGSDNIYGVESMSHGVDVIYLYGGEVKIVTIIGTGQNAVEVGRQTISSLDMGGVGSLNAVEYVIDISEVIHFVYKDTNGTLDDYRNDDIMYYNTSIMNRTLVARGFRDDSFNGSWGSDYNTDAIHSIAVDSDANPIITYVRRDIFSVPLGLSTTYSIRIVNPLTQDNITIESNYESNIYSNLELTGGSSTIGFSYDRSGINISGSIIADPLSVDLP